MRSSCGKYGLLLLTIFFSFVLLTQIAFAGVGLSPAGVHFEKMVRNGYAERYLTISNPTDEDTEVTVSVEGEISGWLSAEPAMFNMSGISYKIVKVITRPPAAIPNGIYRGRVLIVSKPRLQPEALAAGSRIAVASAVSADASVEISDLQLLRYKVENVRLLDTEECRPIIITTNLRNTGNVNVTPRFHVDIRSRDGGTVLQQYDHTSEPIFPTTKARVNIRVPYQMEQFKCIPDGKYKANMRAYADGSVMDTSTLDFQVFPRGTLTVSGEILDLKVPSNVTLGEIAKIEALFKNTGEVPVVAKLNVEVYHGGRLVETLESDPVEVGMGGVNPLVAYFTPKGGGKYTFLVSAVFEDRQSNIREAELEVFWPSEYWLIGGIAGATVAGGIAFFLLRRKGKGKPRRKRR